MTTFTNDRCDDCDTPVGSQWRSKAAHTAVHERADQLTARAARVKAAQDETPTFARVFAAQWSKMGAEQDGPPSEETPDGPDAKPTRLTRMEDDA